MCIYSLARVQHSGCDRGYLGIAKALFTAMCLALCFFLKVTHQWALRLADCSLLIASCFPMTGVEAVLSVALSTAAESSIDKVQEQMVRIISQVPLAVTTPEEYVRRPVVSPRTV